MRTGLRPVLFWLLAIQLAAVAVRGQDAAEMLVEIRARAVAPGEPLRVVVASPFPLATLEGRFLDRDVFLVREGSTAEGIEVWSGWAMIDLDREDGVAVFEFSGTRADGQPAVATHAVTIQPKQFPEEQLSVAPRYVEPPKDVQRRLADERAKLKKIYRSRGATAAPERVFVRPVAGEPTSVFGTRRIYNGKPRSPHPGLDLRASTGTPVAASGSGTVTLAQDLYYSGNTVIIDHGGGLFTLYAHLSEIGVQTGQTVAAGATIGQAGATGRVTGPHLHWGAKIGDRPFDPTALLDPQLF
jgi:murein DD-endopeptidase MepM/ murein hydrolase activator NlpD